MKGGAVRDICDNCHNTNQAETKLSRLNMTSPHLHEGAGGVNPG